MEQLKPVDASAMLVDGHGMLYRALYAPGAPLTNKHGRPTRATYIFWQLLNKLVNDRPHTYWAVCFDPPRHELRRRQLYPAYKANRDSGPELSAEDLQQIKDMRKLVTKLRVPVEVLAGWEADDAVASLKAFVRSQGVRKVTLVSRDKDLHQLVDKDCSMFDPLSGDTVHVKDVQERWGVPPKLVADMQALTGDARDNVPGVKGIGPKTAAKLLGEYGSLKGLLDNLDDLKPKLADAIRRTDVGLMHKLVKLRSDLPTDLNLPRMRMRRGLDKDNARDFLDFLGFNTNTPASRAGWFSR
jgi:DNA polymerase-1